jgi:hypothetical protein
MDIADAQLEVRSVFLGGFFGQLVSGALWLLSAAIATWCTPKAGFWVLVLGGTLIFPLTLLLLRLTGRQTKLSPANSLHWLGMQVAFTIPCSLPLAVAAAVHRVSWFYPACMLIVGAHYLPYMFLYGMWQFAILAAAMLGGGVAIGLYVPEPITLGGWLTGIALVLFAFVGRRIVAAEQHSAAGSAS